MGLVKVNPRVQQSGSQGCSRAWIKHKNKGQRTFSDSCTPLGHTGLLGCNNRNELQITEDKRRVVE